MNLKQKIAVVAAFAQAAMLFLQVPVSAAAEELLTETVQMADTTETAVSDTTESNDFEEQVTEESTSETDATEPASEDMTDSTQTTAEESTEPTEETLDPTSPEQLTEAFVTRLYAILLGRDPDVVGLRNWTTKLLNGEKTAAEVIHDCVNSQEYLGKKTTNEEHIAILYRTLLDREPDEAGFASWCEKATMFSRTYLLRGFVQSAEFSQLCNTYQVNRGNITLTENRDKNPEVTRYITNLYVESLGRDPDSAGLNNWTGKVLNGVQTLNEVILSCTNSSEFMEKNSTNEKFVAALYPCILGRQPDSAGLAGWVDQMERGKSRFAIYLGMVKSAEFKELCENYGITDYVMDLENVGAAVQVTETCLVYQQPSTSSRNWGYVYKNQILPVTGISGEWLKVSFMNQSGYVRMAKVNRYESSYITLLPVTNIPQCSTIGGVSLPTGCEVTSLAVLMNYLGFKDATKNTLADSYMPRGSIGSTDPNYAFIGTPTTRYSYGAYSGVMRRTAENYFEDMSVEDYAVNDLTGAAMDELYAQIDAGNPVLVWYTMNCTSKRTYGATWSLLRGTSWTEPGSGFYSFTWKNNEHCSVLVGYNKTRNTVVLADVWANSGAATGALTEYSVSAFESAYNWLGNQALTITQTPAE